ncbi:hypothetical protein ACN38_g4131 [Penicillium nordicum]|uniref:Fungal N-terminal domain-containing protein n=1 Tax=Penicillium nordicum TaxID=229535 RepID=A0A0M8PBW0_9EURO|nr:hypothetical protein ACN38_g4131 [Penicillium nordicum]
MRFATIITYALAVTTGAAMSLSDMVSDVQHLTSLAHDATDLIMSINNTNAPQKGPLLINKMTKIRTVTEQDVAALSKMRSFETRQECLDAENPRTAMRPSIDARTW